MSSKPQTQQPPSLTISKQPWVKPESTIAQRRCSGDGRDLVLSIDVGGVGTGTESHRRSVSRTGQPNALTLASKEELAKAQNEAAEIKKQLDSLEERYALEKERRTSLERELESFRGMALMSPRSARQLSSSSLNRETSSRLLSAIGQFSREQGRVNVKSESPSRKSPELAPSSSPEPAHSPQPQVVSPQVLSPLAQPCSPTAEDKDSDEIKKLRESLAAKEKQCAELELKVQTLMDSSNKERTLYKEREAHLLARIEGLNRQLETLTSKRKQESSGGSTDDLSSVDVAELQKAKKSAEKSEKEHRALLAEERQFYSQQFSVLDGQLRMLTGICASLRMAESRSHQSALNQLAGSDTENSLGGSDGVSGLSVLGSAPATLFDGNAAGPTAQDLKSALNEYQTFTDAFLRTITLIDETFRKPILTKLTVDPITQMRLPKIFSNMDSLSDSTQKLFARAKKACSKRNLTGLGQVFTDIYNSASLFDKYFQDFESSILLVCDLYKGPAFMKLVTKSEAKQSCGGKSLEDFLLVPIEHFSEYTRLLLQICQSLPARHPETSALEQALVLFSQINQTWSDRLEEARSILSVVKVSKSLLNCPATLVQAKRRYLLESPANVIDDKGKSHKRYFFVFNDLLLECRVQKSAAGSGSSSPEPSRSTQYKFVVQTSLNGASIQSLPDTDGLTNALRINCVNSSVTLCLNTTDMKYVWMSKLAKVLSTIPAPSAAAVVAALFGPTSPSSTRPNNLLTVKAAPRSTKSQLDSVDHPRIERRMSNSLLPRVTDSPTQKGRQKRSETLGGPEQATQEGRPSRRKAKRDSSASPPVSADSSPNPDDPDSAHHKHVHTHHKHHGTAVEKFSTDLHSIKGTATVSGHGHHPRSPLY